MNALACTPSFVFPISLGDTSVTWTAIQRLAFYLFFLLTLANSKYQTVNPIAQFHLERVFSPSGLSSRPSFGTLVSKTYGVAVYCFLGRFQASLRVFLPSTWRSEY